MQLSSSAALGPQRWGRVEQEARRQGGGRDGRGRGDGREGGDEEMRERGNEGTRGRPNPAPGPPGELPQPQHYRRVLV